MHLRTASRERSGDSNLRPYNAALMQVGFCYRSMQRTCHCWKPSLTLDGQSPIKQKLYDGVSKTEDSAGAVENDSKDAGECGISGAVLGDDV